MTLFEESTVSPSVFAIGALTTSSKQVPFLSRRLIQLVWIDILLFFARFGSPLCAGMVHELGSPDAVPAGTLERDYGPGRQPRQLDARELLRGPKPSGMGPADGGVARSSARPRSARKPRAFRAGGQCRHVGVGGRNLSSVGPERS